MGINEIHAFDAQTTFEVQILQENGEPYPLGGALVMNFIFQKPETYSLITRPALLVNDGSDGKVKYTTDDTDLDEVGLWRYQVYIEKGLAEKHSDIGQFRVYPNLPLE